MEQDTSWIEIASLAANTATPIVMMTLGILLLRRMEDVKATVSSRWAFRTKWADDFYSCCQSFMAALEEELAFLTVVVSTTGPTTTNTASEIRRLSILLSELELRIRRSAVFAPDNRQDLEASAKECLRLLRELLAKQGGNVDTIINAMNCFNKASRKAHAEMLGIWKAKGIIATD